MSSRYYSRWSKQTIRQPELCGGLNAQQYDFQLAALHSKWIKLLIDPSAKASWKMLPHDNLMDLKLDRSIFICDQSVVNLRGLPSRWKCYLQGWFAEGFEVADPRMDFECLLNESLWFNRFILKKDDGKPFGHYLTQSRLVQDGGPLHISDVVTRRDCFPSNLTFLDAAELRSKFGKTTAKILQELIDCIPLGWYRVIWNKVREPFQPGDWVIERKYAKLSLPPHVYKLTKCISGKVIGVKCFLDTSTGIVLQDSIC